MLHSICQQIWKTQQWPQDWKRSRFTPIPNKSNAKECSNYCTIALISHAGKIMLKILQDRIQQYVNCELPDVHAGFRKDRETRDQIANTCWIIVKAREFQENIYFFFLFTMPKPLTVWITTNCGKFLKRWEYQTTLPASWEICMQVKKQLCLLELDMEQWTGSKLGKEYVHLGCILSPCWFNLHASCEMPGWMKHKLESRLPGEILITSDTQMTPPLWQEAKRK